MVAEGGIGEGMGVGAGALVTDCSAGGTWLTVQPPLPRSIRSWASFFLLSKRFRSFHLLSVLFVSVFGINLKPSSQSMHSLQVRFGAGILPFCGFFCFIPVFPHFCKRNWKEFPQIEFLRNERQDYS